MTTSLLDLRFWCGFWQRVANPIRTPEDAKGSAFVLPRDGEGKAAGVAGHVRMRLAPTARSIILAKPAVVNGEPRSLTKTKGDVSLSRWSRRRVRSSSPPERMSAGRAVLDHVENGGADST
jgi:hypothetical protein